MWKQWGIIIAATILSVVVVVSAVFIADYCVGIYLHDQMQPPAVGGEETP